MKRVLVLGAIFFAAFGVSAGEVRYVANGGDDAADGKTPATAWRSIEKVNDALPAGATVRFKCGDVFYGGVKPPAGVDAAHPTVLTSYGEGAKPVISCTKNLKDDPAIWEPFNPGYGIWRVALTNDANYTGIRTADANPGFLLVDGEVKPWKQFTRFDVNKPWDFCGEDGWLYVYALDNPAKLSKDIRVSVNVHGVWFRSHTVISNLAVRATGAHGFVGGWKHDYICEHVRISDCDFENIGGSELTGYSESMRVRYGNGVEFGSNCRNAIVERCTFKGVYDVAFTMQGYPTLTGWQDVHVRNCTMTDCTQAFEIWCGRAPKGMGFERCSFTGNRTLRVGGGWGAESRPNRQTATPLLMYGMGTDTVDIDVFGNMFEDAPRGVMYKSGGLDKVPAGYRVHDNVLKGIGADDPFGRARGD